MIEEKFAAILVWFEKKPKVGNQDGFILSHPFDEEEYGEVFDGYLVSDNLTNYLFYGPFAEGLYLVHIAVTFQWWPSTQWEPEDSDITLKMLGVERVSINQEVPKRVRVYDPVSGTAEASYEGDEDKSDLQGREAVSNVLDLTIYTSPQNLRRRVRRGWWHNFWQRSKRGEHIQ